MTLRENIRMTGECALTAVRELVQLNSRRKNNILRSMADELDARREAIAAANAEDVQEAHNAGLSGPRLDRLVLDSSRMSAMVKHLRDVADLRDPIGAVISRWIRPNGLEIVKRRVPIGVIAVIYEAAPMVTADAVAVCVKTSNAVILRGGKEAIRTNEAIANALIEGGRKKGLPEHAIQFVCTTDRAAVAELVQLEGLVDLVIPRGGDELVEVILSEARVPVVKHFKGVCHVYVDESADQEMAGCIAVNAKCQLPAVGNAMETLLVHEAIAAEFLPVVTCALREKGVVLRGDEKARGIVPDMDPATEEDWSAEYLDLLLSIRVVDSIQDAVCHINHYGSHHSDAIVASSEAAQKIFCQEVDSAAVYVNASTRFTDGAEFGMGAEIGISTDKMHARGPMGLEELTTYKYLVHGKGQIRE